MYAQVSAVAGWPAVTGSVVTVATCGLVAPVGVDQARCSARAEVADVMAVICPEVQVKVSARPLASVIEVIPYAPDPRLWVNA